MKALILVDFENERLDKESDYFIGHDISAMLEKTNQLIDFCRTQNYKIIFIRHVEKYSETCFVEGSKNTEIISLLHKNPDDLVINKYKISPFYQTNLDQELQGIEEIVVAGILSNLCVRSTIQDAYDREFKITVIADCCASFDQETQDFTFQDLKKTREEIECVKVKDFIA